MQWSVCLSVLQGKGFYILMLYFILNVAYSIGLKNKPIIDIIILTSGFVIRIVYGGVLADIEISKWLYLVVISSALSMGIGKRRNELKQQNNTREVLKYYTESFLDKNLYVARGCKKSCVYESKIFLDMN